MIRIGINYTRYSTADLEALAEGALVWAGSESGVTFSTHRGRSFHLQSWRATEAELTGVRWLGGSDSGPRGPWYVQCLTHRMDPSIIRVLNPARADALRPPMEALALAAEAQRVMAPGATAQVLARLLLSALRGASTKTLAELCYAYISRPETARVRVMKNIQTKREKLTDAEAQRSLRETYLNGGHRNNMNWSRRKIVERAYEYQDAGAHNQAQGERLIAKGGAINKSERALTTGDMLRALADDFDRRSR